MVTFPLENFINYTAFISLMISSVLIFFFGKTSTLTRRSIISNYILALGIAFIGLSHLLRVEVETFLSTPIMITSLVGGIFTLFGAFVVSYDAYGIIKLKRKYEEIKLVISKLKNKYYRQEISEDDLRRSHADLLRELTELEVKLGKTENKEE